MRGEKGEWRERKDSSCKFCRNSTLQAKCRLRHKGPNEREEGGLRGREGEEEGGTERENEIEEERGVGRRRKGW